MVVEREFQTLNDILFFYAQECPDHPALVWEDETVSYATLEARVSRLAGGLSELGFTKGDKLALLLGNCPEFLYTILAAARIGIVFVPINPELTESEVRYILHHSDARALVTAPGRAQLARDFMRQSPALRTIIWTESPGTDNTSLADLWSSGRRISDQAVTSEDPASLMYTSGTTGLPKGVILPHRAYGYGPVARARRLDWGSDDRIMVVTPIFHVVGLAYLTIAAFAVGATVVLRPRFSASTFWGDVRHYRVTGTAGLSTIPMILWNRPPTPDDAHHPLEVIVGAITPEVWEAFEERFGLTVVSSYGQTEDLATIVNFRDRDRRKLGPGVLGMPVSDERHQVRIVDDQGRELPPGQIGEIVKKGPGLMLGYYKDNAATATAIKDGWFFTGDYGRMDEHGFVYFVDRKKDIIKRSGENISAAEIEQALDSNPLVAEVIAISVPDPIRQEEVKVFVRLNEGVTEAEAPPSTLFTYLAQRLAAFKVPRYLEYVVDFPRTPTMKVQKKIMKQQPPGTVYERLPDGTIRSAS